MLMFLNYCSADRCYSQNLLRVHYCPDSPQLSSLILLEKYNSQSVGNMGVQELNIYGK